MNPLFAAEKTLGKLAKWLRLLGFDTVYDPFSDSRLFAEKNRGHRILLTRTEQVRKMHASSRLIFIESNACSEQLRQVVKAAGIRPADIRPFTRCLGCNLKITAVDKESLRGRVPDYIWETQADFRICPGCGKIYWRGSHTWRSLERVRQLFADS